MSNEIQAPKQSKSLTIRDHLQSDAMRKQLADALPKHMTPDRMARVALTALTKTPKLAQCDQASFFQALLTCSAMGLEPDGRLAHLIPFANNKTGKTDCQLIIDYKGLVELAYRSGMVKSIHADVIREGDIFEYNLGSVVRHVPWAWRQDKSQHKQGDIIGAYCVVTMDSACKHEVMTRDEIESIRKRSRSGGSGPWVTDFAEMAKKGLAVDTPIPTPNGWTTMGDLQAGDVVFDMHGKQTEVLAVSEVKHIDCYRMTLSNGDSIVCDDEHRWCATIGSDGYRNRANGWPVHTINELYLAKTEGKPISIPVAGSLDTPEIDLPVDPWVLGYWLGNGKTSDGNVTCHQDDARYLEERIRLSYPVGAIRKDTRSKAVSIGIKKLKVSLRSIGALGTKVIPDIYLRASISQRLSLLQGLMDSDGHIDKSRGRAHFYSTNQGLAAVVAELARSLGNKVYESCKEMSGYGKIVKAYYVGWLPLQPCVTTPRKLANYKPRKIAPYCSVKSIEKIQSVPTKCIAVSAETKTYLCGTGMIPTHNTVFRRASKWIPLSSEIRDALEKDDDKLIESQSKVISVTELRNVFEGDAVVQEVDEPARDEPIVGKL